MSSGGDDSKVVKIRPDIYQIRSEKPGSHVYVIKGTNKNVMIDTGMTANFTLLTQRLGEIGLAQSDINLIILTHEHFDHIGATTFFFDTAIVCAHRLAANKIELQDEFVTGNKYNNVPCKPFHAHMWLENDTLIELGNHRLRAVHTPGHTSGCLCLYEPDERLLFTGDTVFAGGTLSGIFTSGNISDYMNSLLRLSTLRVDEFYPGHGWPSTTPESDMRAAVGQARALFEDSKILFEALTKRGVQSTD